MGSGVTSLNFDLGEGQPSLVTAFIQVAVGEKTGILSLRSSSAGKAEFRKEFVFQKGEPVAVITNRPQERLVYHLITHGILTNEQLKELNDQSIAVNDTNKVLGALLGKSWISQDRIPELLEKYFTEKLFGLLNLRRGSIHFKDLGELPSKALSVDPYRLSRPFKVVLWEQIKKSCDLAFCRSSLAQYSKAQFYAESDFPLPLPASDLRLWNDLKKKPAELESADALPLLLVVVGLENKVIRTVHAAKGDPAKDLEQTLRKLKRASFYEILEIEPTSDASIIKKNYLQLVKKFHPDRGGRGSNEVLRKLCEAVLAVINEAYDTLSDAEKKEEYDAQRAFDAQGGMAGLEKKLKAEMTYEEARMAIRRKQFGQAHQLLKSVTEDLSEYPEFRVDYLLCRNMDLASSGGIDGAQLLKDIAELEALKKTVKDRTAVLFSLGVLFRIAQQPDRALTYFDQVLEREPQHSEAQQEARLFRMRQTKEDKPKSKSWFKKT